MAEGCPVSDHMVWSFCLGEEFCAGWEGLLEGACLAQLKFNVEDAVCVGVLRAEQNGFLVLVEEVDFPRTGPWHCDGWVHDFIMLQDARVARQTKYTLATLRVALYTTMHLIFQIYVRMPDCLDGIEPCECKRKGHRF